MQFDGNARDAFFGAIVHAVDVFVVEHGAVKFDRQRDQFEGIDGTSASIFLIVVIVPRHINVALADVFAFGEKIIELVKKDARGLGLRRGDKGIFDVDFDLDVEIFEAKVFVDKLSLEEATFELDAGGDLIESNTFDFVDIDRESQNIAFFEVLDIDDQFEAIV